jgi:hypothetical protein
VTLRFNEALDRAPALVGALSYEGKGTEWTYICNGESNQLRHAAEALGATVVGQATLTLDEIFVSRVLS